MGYYDFPHTRNYDTDLGYLIKQYLNLRTEVETLIATQTINYADPLQWDITTQYAKNYIVVNGYNAYLSKQPVPKGILITNTDYWLVVGDFIKEFDDLRANIVNANNGVSPTLLIDKKQGDLLWWNDTLYICLKDIEAGTALIVDNHVKQITVKEYINSESDILKTLSTYTTPEFYGAKGDGITDDSDAIIASIDSGLPVFLKNNYLVSKTLTLKNNFYCTGTITFNSDIGIIINTSYKNYYIHELIGNGSNTGILVDSLIKNDPVQHSNIEFNYIHDVNIGIQIIPTNGGIQYCNFNNGEIGATTYGIYIKAKNNNVYINENTFNNIRLYGGTGLFFDTNENTSETSYNGNTFTNCGFELLDDCIVANNVDRTSFINCRLIPAEQTKPLKDKYITLKNNSSIIFKVENPFYYKYVNCESGKLFAEGYQKIYDNSHNPVGSSTVITPSYTQINISNDPIYPQFMESTTQSLANSFDLQNVVIKGTAYTYLNYSSNSFGWTLYGKYRYSKKYAISFITVIEDYGKNPDITIAVDGTTIKSIKRAGNYVLIQNDAGYEVDKISDNIFHEIIKTSAYIEANTTVTRSYTLDTAIGVLDSINISILTSNAGSVTTSYTITDNTATIYLKNTTGSGDTFNIVYDCIYH